MLVSCGVIVAVSSMPVSRIAAKSRSIKIDGLPASSSQTYFCVVPSRRASSRWLSPDSSRACCKIRPSDSALVTFPVYATTPPDSDIEVMINDFDIGVNQGDVDIDVEWQRASAARRGTGRSAARFVVPLFEQRSTRQWTSCSQKKA